jgi:proline iminopeptidase
VDREEIIEVDGAIALWTVMSGTPDGPPLVLCHGGPGLWDMLGGVAAMIDDLVPVLRYDQRGCRRSPAPPPYTVDRWLSDLDAIRAHLGCERWLLGGHSWGASLALLWALRAPAATLGVVAISPPGLGPPEGDDHRRERDRRLGPDGRKRLAALARDMEGGTATPEVATAHRRLLWETDLGPSARGHGVLEPLLEPGSWVNVDATRAGTEDWRRVVRSLDADALRALRVPALIIAGEADPRPLEPVRALADQMPRAGLHVLRDVGHFPWIESPDRVRTLMRRFLDATLG